MFVHETVSFIALSHIEEIEFCPLKNNIVIKIKSILSKGTKKRKGNQKKRDQTTIWVLVTYYTIAITSTQNMFNGQMLHIYLQTWQFC